MVNDVACKDDDIRLSLLHGLEDQAFAVTDIGEMEVGQDDEPNLVSILDTSPVMRDIDPVGFEKGGIEQEQHGQREQARRRQDLQRQGHRQCDDVEVVWLRRRRTHPQELNPEAHVIFLRHKA